MVLKQRISREYIIDVNGGIKELQERVTNKLVEIEKEMAIEWYGVSATGLLRVQGYEK